MKTSFIKIANFEVDTLRKQIETEEKAGDPGTLFAILDACDAPSVPEKADLSGDRAVSLYREAAQEACRSFAPYLFHVDLEIFDWIIGSFQSEPWGVFLTAAPAMDTMEKLRAHFQQFITVLGPDDEEMYFRFYDPRVLPVYLSSGLEEEVDRFFGPVRRFFINDTNGRAFSIMKSGIR